MEGNWNFQWDNIVASSGNAAETGQIEGPSRAHMRKPYHRRSNSTPLEHTSSVLLNSPGEDRGDAVQTEQQDFPAATDAQRVEKLRAKREPKPLRRTAFSAGLKNGGAAGSRVSARNTKGKSKLAVLHEGHGVSSDEDQELSGDDSFGPIGGRGDKVKRVLANRQSAQRSRIRKLAHVEELMQTAQILQNDINKLGPQLSALLSKQAGLDKESEALQERLAMLTQESQRKDSVNQSLTHELASYAQAQQQAQQQTDQHPQHQPSQSSMHRQWYEQQQQQQHVVPSEHPYDQHQHPGAQLLKAERYSKHGGTLTQSQLSNEEPDIVERLMQRYQYDQAQAWQRHQQQQQQQQHQQQQQQQQHQQEHKQRQQQLQWQQQQQQAASPPEPAHHRRSASGEQAQQFQSQQQYQSQEVLTRHQSAPTQQSPRSPPSWSYQDLGISQAPSAEPPRNQSVDNAQTRSPDMPRQDTLINANAQQPYLYPQQQGVYEQAPHPPRHSFDTAQPQQSNQHLSTARPRTADSQQTRDPVQPGSVLYHEQQQAQQQQYYAAGGQSDQQAEPQSLFRTQSLTPYQSQLHRHSLASSGQAQQQTHQLTLPEQALRHLQRSGPGQASSELRFIPARGHSPQVGSWHTAPGSNQSYQHNQPLEQSALVQQHPQQHQQQQLLNSGSISHHSASHLSRHSSAGSDAQQSDILPSDALLRTWDVISNTSSEPSEAAGNAYGANVSMLPQSVTGSGQQQAGQRLGSAELRQLAWSRGVPPTGKKKKDLAANRTVFGRLV